MGDYIPMEVNMTHTNIKQRTQTVTQMIHYVDEDERPVHEDYVASLNFTQSGILDEMTGQEIWNGDWVPETTAEFMAVTHPEVKNHHLASSEAAEVDAYEVEVNDETFDNPLFRTHKVVYEHNLEHIRRTQVVTQTIHYKYEDGTIAYPDHTVSLIFTQPGVRDLTNGREFWDNNWMLVQDFDMVPSPVIDGFVADKKKVGPYVITVDNDNFVEKQDKEETIIYRKDAELKDASNMELPTNRNEKGLWAMISETVRTFFGITEVAESDKD